MSNKDTDKNQSQNQRELTKIQKILKTIQVICMVIWIDILVKLIIGAVVGTNFFLETIYGFESIYVTVITLVINYWWILLPLLIYLIAFGIFSKNHKEYKQYNYKNFIICSIICICVLCVAYNKCVIILDIIHNNTWNEKEYSDINMDIVIIPYSNNENIADLVNTSRTLEYDEIFSLATEYAVDELRDCILKYTGNYNKYSLVVSPVINSRVYDYNTSNVEVTGDNAKARLNIEYVTDNSDNKSLIVILINSFSVEDYKFTPVWTQVKELDGEDKIENEK